MDGSSADSMTLFPRIPLDARTTLMMPFAFLGSFGPMEMALLAGVCLLLFGNRLPSVMRSLGQSVTEFKKGVSGIEDDIDRSSNAEKKPAPPGPHA
jgi:sec-independent protein translocase protein TatA